MVDYLASTLAMGVRISRNVIITYHMFTDFSYLWERKYWERDAHVV